MEWQYKKIAGAPSPNSGLGVPLTGVRASGCFHSIYYPVTFLVEFPNRNFNCCAVWLKWVLLEQHPSTQPETSNQIVSSNALAACPSFSWGVCFVTASREETAWRNRRMASCQRESGSRFGKTPENCVTPEVSLAFFGACSVHLDRDGVGADFWSLEWHIIKISSKIKHKASSFQASSLVRLSFFLRISSSWTSS